MPSYTSRTTKKGTVYDVRFRIIDENGFEVNRRLCGYASKKAAQQAYIDFMKTYTPPTFKLQKRGDYIFDDLFALYKKSRQVTLEVSSYYDLNWIFDKFITPHFQGKSLTDIKKDDYATWQTDLWASINPKNNNFYTQRYLNKIRTTLSTFLSWCEETYEIPNLLDRLKKPKRKEIKKEMQFWEISEFLKFEKTVDNVLWKTFFMGLFYSGCRVGEILALSDNDVIKANEGYSFTINKSLTRKTNKGKVKFLITAPKTEQSTRKVQLPESMTKQIDEYFAYKQKNGLGSTFFFGGDKPIAQRTYQRWFAKYTADAGLKSIRIHDLRHSHASMLIQLNVPITAISKRLGHSSVKMTLERYSHCYSDADSAAVSAINLAVIHQNYGTNCGTNIT